MLGGGGDLGDQEDSDQDAWIGGGGNLVQSHPLPGTETLEASG